MTVRHRAPLSRWGAGHQKKPRHQANTWVWMFCFSNGDSPDDAGIFATSRRRCTCSRDRPAASAEGGG